MTTVRTDNPIIQVRMAISASEYAEAFRIAYEVYFAKGFTPYSKHGMRATPYQFLPGAVVFLAYADNRAVATLTIYEGQGCDLPSASGWPDEMADLHSNRLRVFELGALMVRPTASQVANPLVCLELFRNAWCYARRMRSANRFCAFVQAHHQTFYEKILGFHPFGTARDYEWNGLTINAVIPFILDLDTAEADYRRRFERFGSSSRNLYRFFVLDSRDSVAARLTNDTSQWRRRDLAALRQTFSHLLPREDEMRPSVPEERPAIQTGHHFNEFLPYPVAL